MYNVHDNEWKIKSQNDHRDFFLFSSRDGLFISLFGQQTSINRLMLTVRLICDDVDGKLIMRRAFNLIFL